MDKKLLSKILREATRRGTPIPDDSKPDFIVPPDRHIGNVPRSIPNKPSRERIRRGEDEEDDFGIPVSRTRSDESD